MDTLPIELIIDVLRRLKPNDILMTTTKNLFYLRYFLSLEIVQECTGSHDKYLHKNINFDRNYSKKFKNIRTKQITISSNYAHSHLMVYHRNFECLKTDFVFHYVVKNIQTLKTLIVTSTEKNELSINLPKSLRKLIIPHKFMNEYPDHLTYLVCLHKPNDTLDQLKKLCITNQDKYCRYRFPENIEVLSIYTSDNLFITYPLKLRKLITKKTNRDRSMSYSMIETKNMKCLRMVTLFLQTHLITKSFVGLKHFTIKTNIFTNDDMNYIIGEHDLESLTIKYVLLDIFTKFPPHLKKFVLIYNGINTFQQTINFPDTLTHLAIISDGARITSTFVLPPHLTYLKLITQHVCDAILSFPDTLKTLILDIRAQFGTFPRNLIYLDVKTDDLISLLSIENLSQLKYLVLEENCVMVNILNNIIPFVLDYPKSLRYLKRNIRHRNVPNHIKLVTWFHGTSKYQNYGAIQPFNFNLDGVNDDPVVLNDNFMYPILLVPNTHHNVVIGNNDMYLGAMNNNFINLNNNNYNLDDMNIIPNAFQ